jgi:hypothetical protein
MTQMSDPGLRDHARMRAKSLKSPGWHPLAHGVHDPLTVLLLFAFLLVGCVIPPSLSVDNQDAGVNSPPAILSVRSDQQALAEPGPVVFARGSGTIQLSLLDTDLLDALEVRVFVNYTPSNTTAPRSVCKASANGTPQRTTTCDLAALCLPADDNVENLQMSIVVFDRPVQDSGTPAFQAMAPGSGGLATDKFYFLTCQPPATP